MESPERSGRPRRRDAEENRARVRLAAELVFAERGLAASMQDIADAAGLGVGTAHRAYGSKRDLQREIFQGILQAGVEVLVDLSRRPSAWDALCDWLRLNVDALSRNRGLHDVLYGADRHLDLGHMRGELRPLLDALVSRAQREGALRADFAAADVPILTLMVSRLAHGDPVRGPHLAHRALELTLKGLGPSPDPRPVPAALSDDDMEVWWRSLG